MRGCFAFCCFLGVGKWVGWFGALASMHELERVGDTQDPAYLRWRSTSTLLLD